MVELAGNIKGKKIADLGAGDGRISIAFAKKGAVVDAFELDENQLKTLEKNLEKETSISSIYVKQENFWNADFSSYDVLCIYPMPDIMEVLEQKIKNEARNGTKVIINYYMFPNLKYEKQKDNVFLYEV